LCIFSRIIQNGIILNFKLKNSKVFLYFKFFLTGCKTQDEAEAVSKSKPNTLFAIADDQSFPYTRIYGTNGLKTPAFDRVAKEGVLFTNAFVPAPQRSPSRAAILTGKNIWEIEEAGTHASYFLTKHALFTDLLETVGYEIGFKGKPWSPGNLDRLFLII
jgi:N-sulfoglucosamine sulfohydrolase